MILLFGFQKRNKRRQSYRVGIWAEFLSALYLWVRGYKILARRYKAPSGEIDLIARKANALVAVEVKARSDMSDALEAVSLQNRRRVENAVLLYVAQNPEYASFEIRFDIIAVCLGKGFGFRRIRHLENAWESRR